MGRAGLQFFLTDTDGDGNSSSGTARSTSSNGTGSSFSDGGSGAGQQQPLQGQQGPGGSLPLVYRLSQDRPQEVGCGG